MSAPGLSLSRSRMTRAIAWSLGGPVLLPVGGFLGSLMVIAGPWLISVAALAVISVSFEPALGRAGIEDLRLTVIYALCLAPLTAGPAGAVAARLVRESIEAGVPGRVGSLCVVGLVTAGLGAFGLALLASAALGIDDRRLVLAFCFLTVASAELWVSLAILAVLRSYGFMLIAFAASMALSVLAMFLAAGTTMSIDFLVWSFTVGLFCFVMLTTGRAVGRAWPQAEDLAPAAGDFLRSFAQQRFLVLGIVFALLAVWVDKWVFWFGPEGVTSDAGFRHFGHYDSVMFVAHLSILPAFAAMSQFHDGPLTRVIEEVRSRLNQRATHDSLQASVNGVAATAWSGVFLVVFIQGIVTIAAVLMAPMISRLLDFDVSQFFLLRIGLVAVFLHSVIYLCGTILVMCGRIRLFCAVQGLHLAANLVFSVSFHAGAGITAYGFFAASLAVAPIAFAAAHGALSSYLYYALVGENESLYRAA